MSRLEGAIAALTVSYVLFSVLKPPTSDPSSHSHGSSHEGYNPGITATWFYEPGIDRTDLDRMLRLGEGISNDGRFARPIPVEEAFEGMPSDATGIFEAPFRWEPSNSVLYTIENGYVISSDFRLTGGAKREG